MKERTPSFYGSSRFRSSNLKNIGSECAINEQLFTALIALFCKDLIFCSLAFFTPPHVNLKVLSIFQKAATFDHNLTLSS